MTSTLRFRNDQDFVNQYLKEIRPYPKLEKNEERELLNRYKDTGDKQALDKLITSNLRFVVSVAVKYQYQGLSLPELINEGNLGLIEAVNRFKPSDYSVKFISYAVWWIRQSIIKALYEKSRLVRVSAEKESKMRQVNRMTELSLQEFGRVDYDFVARRSQSKPSDVEQILSLASNRVSMDEPVGDDNEATTYDILPDEHTEAPDDVLEREGLRHCVSDMIGMLNEQEQNVVRLYFGIDSDTEYNLEQIGRKMRLSKERVRQVKKQALEKMKEHYQSYELASCA